MISVDVGPVKGSSVKEGLAFEIIEAFVKVGVKKVHAAGVRGIPGKEGGKGVLVAAKAEGVVPAQDGDGGHGEDDDDEKSDCHGSRPGRGVLAEVLCRGGLQGDVPSGAVVIEGGLVAGVSLKGLLLCVHSLTDSLVQVTDFERKDHLLHVGEIVTVGEKSPALDAGLASGRKTKNARSEYRSRDCGVVLMAGGALDGGLDFIATENRPREGTEARGREIFCGLGALTG